MASWTICSIIWDSTIIWLFCSQFISTSSNIRFAFINKNVIQYLTPSLFVKESSNEASSNYVPVWQVRKNYSGTCYRTIPGIDTVLGENAFGRNPRSFGLYSLYYLPTWRIFVHSPINITIYNNQISLKGFSFKTPNL